MRPLALFLVLVLGFVFTACDSGGPAPETVTIQTDFSSDADGWTALFSNYPRGEEAFYELDSGIRPLPASVSAEGSGFYLYGNNHSDDLNMHLVRRVEGLVPGARYHAQFRVAFATDAPAGCVGVGGSPGESVTVHAVAVQEQPRLASDAYTLTMVERYEEVGERDSWYRAFGIGDVANDLTCEEALPERPYRLKTLESAPAHATVKADRSGRAWLLVGTRSGFEAMTGLYYTRIEVVLRPA